jgi:hypothetical protein
VDTGGEQLSPCWRLVGPADHDAATLEGAPVAEVSVSESMQLSVQSMMGVPPLDRKGADMMIRVWEYEVAAGSVAEFEAAYGANGDWAQLFATESGFRGTALYRSVAAPERYLTVDLFTDVAAWERLIRDEGDAYNRLDARTAHLTLRETELVAATTSDNGGTR